MSGLKKLESDYTISTNPKLAIRSFLNYLTSNLWPMMMRIKQNTTTMRNNENYSKLKDLFSLCCSQIKKCVIHLIDIFRIEYQEDIILQESRNCILERLSWCTDRLSSLEKIMKQFSNEAKEQNDTVKDFLNDSILSTPIYFVNWIDDCLGILTNFSKLLYETDHKESILSENWKYEVLRLVNELHQSIEELLMSAMMLCKYCLACDQHVLMARCQVVLRESKNLINEIIETDDNAAHLLKMPLKPSNINVLIDVLKDAIYILETNTNTALLGLLIHCFGTGKSPFNTLQDHYRNAVKCACPCDPQDHEDLQDCSYIKEFDLYNERLVQIGNFAISCSSDQNRILLLKSGLASLEALEPHLVPSIMLAPENRHTSFLIKCWNEEVEEIRNNVFLIVDPAAFTEKSKQMTHKNLLEVIQKNSYDNKSVCVLINIGCVVYEFFTVYDNHEPGEITQSDKLSPLLQDLKKAVNECKIVSNLLSSSDNDFLYDVKSSKQITNDPTFVQLLKRLKLMYTMINRINCIFNKKDNDDQLFITDCYEDDLYKTHSVAGNVFNTYVKSLNKKPDVSRSTFARTANFTTEQGCLLSKLTNGLKTKGDIDLNYSVQLNELFDNISQYANDSYNDVINKHIKSIHNHSVLYNMSPKKDKLSLRRQVLKNRTRSLEDNVLEKDTGSENKDKESFMDTVTSLQITGILNELADISYCVSVAKTTTTALVKNSENSPKNNVLTLSINGANASVSRHMWNIPVTPESSEISTDISVSNISTDSSQPSEVTTLERIEDLELLENRLNNLKLLQHDMNLSL